MRPGFTKVIRAILYGNGGELLEMSLCEPTERQKLSHFARAELGTCECVLSPLQKQLLRHAVSIAPWADLATRCNRSRLVYMYVLRCWLSCWIQMLLCVAPIKWVVLVLNADWSVQWSSRIIFFAIQQLWPVYQITAQLPWWIVILCCIATCCYVSDCF